MEKTFSRVRQRLGWTEQGRTPLATYVGHAKVTDTYWYCTAVPELLACTSQRFEHFAHRALERPS